MGGGLVLYAEKQKSLLDLATEFLDEGRAVTELLKTCRPLVGTLVEQLRDEASGLEVSERLELLKVASGVLDKAAGAALRAVKAADALARLQVLLAGGVATPKGVGEMSEAEVVGVVVKTVQELSAKGGRCVACGTVAA